MNNYLNGNENDLIAYWKLNEGSGDIILDNSINEINGKIILAEYDWGIDYSTLVDVEDYTDVTSLPKRFSLYQNYPNPFNPSTIIKYQIPADSFVQLKIYDILGSEISTLINQRQPSGIYEIEFNNTNIASGMYFDKLSVGKLTETKKMILMK